MYYKHLSHQKHTNSYLFISFRQNISKNIYLIDRISKQSENYFLEMENFLHSYKKYSHIIESNVKIVKDVLIGFDKDLYRLYAYAIMPNHVHLLIRNKVELSKIMRRIKAITSRKIINNIEINDNHMFKKYYSEDRHFWNKGYFDVNVNGYRYYIQTIFYILNNPYKNHLENSKERIYCRDKELFSEFIKEKDNIVKPR